eukprot:3464871-Lingulodinium_polyedra.AAC.1
MARPQGVVVPGAAERPASRVPAQRASGSVHPQLRSALPWSVRGRQALALSVRGRPSTCKTVLVCPQCLAGRHGWHRPAQPEPPPVRAPAPAAMPD